jgi:dTDP-4-amino-4,6-dideoxygalactose transaminase
MQRLDQFVEQRQVLQKRYHELLQDLPLVMPFQFKDSYSALHLYPIQIDLDKVQKTHAEVFEALREAGLGVNVHYIPVHTQPYYQNMGFKLGDFPHAEHYYSRAISIPLFHGMSFEQQDEVVAILKQVLQ